VNKSHACIPLRLGIETLDDEIRPLIYKLDTIKAISAYTIFSCISYYTQGMITNRSDGPVPLKLSRIITNYN
jgi:hypothetical protein